VSLHAFGQPLEGEVREYIYISDAKLAALSHLLPSKSLDRLRDQRRTDHDASRCSVAWLWLMLAGRRSTAGPNPRHVLRLCRSVIAAKISPPQDPTSPIR